MTAQEKLKILHKVLKEGSSVSSVCRQNKISRKTFYSWKKKYQAAKTRRKTTCLENRHLRGLRHPRGLRLRFRKEVLRLVTIHPEQGSHTLSKILKEKGKFLSNHAVYTLLKELGLETYSKRKEFACSYRSPLRLLPEARKRMVEEVLLAGEKVGKIADDFIVSRKTVWKWKERYKVAQESKIELILALKDQNPTGSSHPRGTPVWLEKKILETVLRNPEYSTHKLAQIIPKIGNHGIQNVLFRAGLNTFDRRLEYARLHAPVSLVQPVTGWLNRLKTVWQTFVPTIAPAPPPKLKELAKVFLASFTSSSVLAILFLLWLQMLSGQPVSTKLGLFSASISLFVGSLFFLYSMKYYFTLAVVLSFSSQTESREQTTNNIGNRGWLARIFGLNGSLRGLTSLKSSTEVRPPQGGGLQPSLDHIKLKRYPFISIHLPFYNEKKVAERILKACTSMDWPNYEIVVCDDSTDETTEIIRDYQGRLGKIKEYQERDGTTISKIPASPNTPSLTVIHRSSRSGFKGGALRLALSVCDPRTEFVVVFDADFIPYPDTLELFVKYFQVNGLDLSKKYTSEVSSAKGGQARRNTTSEVEGSKIACVAGYQWHVLNKSENWITRGVRTEYAGSYVIERPGQEILGAMKLIHGSVYAIRADVLRKFGWGTSITEDFELTLRLYEQGYKVVYTPYVQGPAECVSTIKRLIRQRMRWAEGHSHNIRKMFLRLLFGSFHSPGVSFGGSTSSEVEPHKERVWVPSKLTFAEKLEFLYLSPYYLQAFFFLVGTFSWLLAETVFRARLPFWTSLWGWSLVLTNFFSLPLVNAVGLFLEEAEEKDYLGIFSFVFLSYLLVPFQAYASVKGFLEKEEGPWFRTPKTGLITDIFTRGRFYRWIAGIIPGRAKPSLAPIAADINADKRGFRANPYLALATANNRFSSFTIKPKKIKYIGKLLFSLVLLVSTTLLYFSSVIPVMYGLNISPQTAQASVLSSAVISGKQSGQSSFKLNKPFIRDVEAYYFRKQVEGEHKEVVELRGRNSKTYAIDNDLKMIRISTEPVHYQDEENQWQEIDLTINPVDKDGFDFGMTKNEFKVYFAESSKSEFLVLYEKNGKTVKFGLEESQDWGEINEVRATVDKNEITYKEIFAGVDLRYIIDNKQLLEEFIVKDKSQIAKFSKIKKYFEVEGLEPKSKLNGSVEFTEGGDKKSLWFIPRPVMYEVNNRVAENFDLHFEMEKKDDRFYLTKILQPEGKKWLVDQVRNYPVVIDSTIGLNEADILNDGYVINASGTYTRDTTSATAQVGYNTNPRRAFLEFDTTDVTDGITVQSVGIYLYVTSAYGTGDTVDLVQMDNTISSYPNDNTGNQNLYNDIGNETTIYNDNSSGFTSTAARYIKLGDNLGVTNASTDMENKLSGNTPFGVGLIGSDETTHYVAFSTEEDTTATRRPELVVFYSGVVGYTSSPNAWVGRNGFWNGTYYFAILESESSLDYFYSTDGSSWTWGGDIDPSYQSQDSSLWYEGGDTVWVAYRGLDLDDIKMRVGTISGTSISWGTQYTALDGTGSTDRYTLPYIARSSTGICWVMARHTGASSTYGVRVASSTDSNCTAYNPPTTLLADEAGSQKDGELVPLTSGNMYAIYRDDATVVGKLYDGSWQATETIDSTTSSSTDADVSAVAISGTIHAAYIDSDTDLNYIARNGSWGTALEISVGTFANPSISVDTATNDLYLAYSIWAANSATGYIYYKKGESPYGSGNWGGQQTIASDIFNPNYVSLNYSGNGVIFALWREGIYGVEFGSIIVPEKLWLLFGLAPLLPNFIKKRKRLK